MNWMEIALLAFGAGALILSFIIPAKDKKDEEEQQVDAELIRSIIEKEMEDAKNRVTEVVDETLEYAVEKTERSAERLSNEKIMAISDYAETVLADINKAHQEVMFLYDMLNDKHNNLKETVKHVDKTAKEAEEAANAAAVALAAKAREESEARAREKIRAEEAEKEDLERTAAFERAEHDKEAREKEYARRQMARLILPMQPEPQPHRLGGMKAIPLKQEIEPSVSDAGEPTQELRPLIVKSVEIENVKVVDAKPSDIRPIEVYSFVEQAPHIERPVKKEAQAAALENTVNLMKLQEQTAQTAGDQAQQGEENNNDRILRLHKLGVSNVDIAKELGLGVGEVKLVINLFKGAV